MLFFLDGDLLRTMRYSFIFPNAQTISILSDLLNSLTPFQTLSLTILSPRLRFFEKFDNLLLHENQSLKNWIVPCIIKQ